MSANTAINAAIAAIAAHTAYFADKHYAAGFDSQQLMAMGGNVAAVLGLHFGRAQINTIGRKLLASITELGILVLPSVNNGVNPDPPVNDTPPALRLEDLTPLMLEKMAVERIAQLERDKKDVGDRRDKLAAIIAEMDERQSQWQKWLPAILLAISAFTVQGCTVLNESTSSGRDASPEATDGDHPPAPSDPEFDAEMVAELQPAFSDADEPRRFAALYHVVAQQVRKRGRSDLGAMRIINAAARHEYDQPPNRKLSEFMASQFADLSGVRTFGPTVSRDEYANRYDAVADALLEVSRRVIRQ
jgi:hypothetical protein